MDEFDDDEYMREVDEIQELVFEEVFPILMGIDEEYPEHSAFFSMFISTLHVLYEEGWTEEDLLREVKTHREIYLKHAGEIACDGELH